MLSTEGMSLPILNEYVKLKEDADWSHHSKWFDCIIGKDSEGKEVDILKGHKPRINPSILKDLFDACEDYKKINAFGICPRMYGMFTDDADNIYIVFQKIQSIYRTGDIMPDVFLENILTKMRELLKVICKNDLKIELKTDDLILYDVIDHRDFKIMIKRSYIFEEIFSRAYGDYTDTYISLGKGTTVFPYFVPYEKKNGIGSAWTTWKPDSKKSALDYYLHNKYIVGSIIIYLSREIYCFSLNIDYLVHDKLNYAKDKQRSLLWRKVEDDTVYIHKDDISLTEQRISTKVRSNTSLLNEIKKCVAPDPNDRMDHAKDMIPTPKETVFRVIPLIPLPKKTVSTEISHIPLNVSEVNPIIESIAVHVTPPEEKYKSAWVILQDERFVLAGQTIKRLKNFMEEDLGIYQKSDLDGCTLEYIMMFRPYLKPIQFMNFVKAMGFDPNII